MTSALSASVVAAIDDLELAARLVVEGLKAGSHRSPFHGYSAEFQQHRPYRAGDDLKYLDWKILARTDRLYSRQFRESTSMSVMIVLDTSASMNFPAGREGAGISKFRYASILAAALAYLISSHGDAVGLMTMDGGRLAYLPARGGRLHLRALISKIDSLRAQGSWEEHAERVISRGAELLRRRGVVLVISDFYDAEEQIQRALRRVVGRGHDAGIVQVMSREELTFPYSGDVEFRDLESGQRRLLSTDATAAHYKAEVSTFLARCRAAALRDGVDYLLASTADAPDRVLRSYLLRRAAGHQSGQSAAQPAAQ